MGWFEEQIRLRREHDDEAIDEALDGVASVITGKSRVSSLDNRERIKSALDEILTYYHCKSREIPEEISSLEQQIDYQCRPHGIMHRRVKLGRDWQRNAAGAYLGRTKDGEAIALTPGKLAGYTYYDAKSGRRVKATKEMEARLEEEAICFYRPFPTGEMGAADLILYLKSCISKRTLALIVVMTLLTTLIGLLTPKITYIIFHHVIDSGSIRLLLSAAVLSVGVTAGSLLAGAVRSLLTQRLTMEMEVSVQAATMARVLSLPAGFFQDFSSGEISSRCACINSLCSTLVSTLFSTGLTSLMSLLYITQILSYAPSLALPALCVIAATVAVSVVSALMQTKITRRQLLENSKLSGMTYSMITGVQKIKLAGAEKRAFSRWLKHYQKDVELTYDPPKLILLSGVITTAISLAGTIVMYYFAVKSGISTADYYAFTSAYGMVSGAFLSAAGIALTAARIRPMMDMVKPILHAVPEISEDKKAVTQLSGSIEFNNVSFRYAENMPNVIDGLNLKINAGQYIAIVGKTGCGKSTLVRLLLGFEKPRKGAVFYDGRNLNTMDLRSVRKNIGAVTQNGKLFQGDIFSNIVISAPHLTQEDAWKAAELADIADDIRAMPMGMHTMISEGSGGISGGQRQRLMIARAIAPNPKILIFDEATSALDNISQKKVSQALDRLKCTRIVIAHRLSTIRQCDRILVLDRGKIIEDGTYDELIRENGFFAELVERQRLDAG